MSEDKWPKSVPNPQINGQMYCICIENELDLYNLNHSDWISLRLLDFS